MSNHRRTDVRLGAVAWMATALYFPLQAIVAAAWPRPYSFTLNTISDLGITTCGLVQHAPGRDLLVCSPRHLLMNVGFVAFGVMTIAGAVLMRRALPRTRLTTTALTGVVVTGVGGILVGLAPADVAPELHRLGALLRVPGVLAPLLLGLALQPQRPRLAAFCFAAATVGAAGTAMFALQLLGDRVGAAERLALDPFPIWSFVLGAAMLTGTSIDETER